MHLQYPDTDNTEQYVASVAWRFVVKVLVLRRKALLNRTKFDGMRQDWGTSPNQTGRHILICFGKNHPFNLWLANGASFNLYHRAGWLAPRSPKRQRELYCIVREGRNVFSNQIQI